MTLQDLLDALDDAGRPLFPGVARIIAAIERGPEWPKEHEKPILQLLNLYAAIRENNKDALVEAYCKEGKDAKAKYRIDPLGERIAEAWTHYLFGEIATYKPAAESDADLLAALLSDDWEQGLEGAGAICSSEGEVWVRLAALDGEEHTEPEWLSRTAVFPLWQGRELMAAAVWTDLPLKGRSKDVYRHFEIHAKGAVVNLLYRGTTDKIGVRVPLTEHDVTAELEEAWTNGLDFMLIDRVPNRIRRHSKWKYTLGVSDFAGIVDVLGDLNDSLMIGARNMRLTAKQRAVISGSVAANGRDRDDLALTPEEGGMGTRPPKFSTDEEVFQADPLDEELGSGGGKPPFQVLAYSFDAAPLIEWRRELVDIAVGRTGLTGQYVGLGDSSGVQYAISGTAIRLKLIPTRATGDGKARYWNHAIPRILQRLAALDALPPEEGGKGQPWTNVVDLPTYQRAPGIPLDPAEEALRIGGLLGSGAQSLRQSVIELHPHWDDTQIDAEVEAIKADRASTMPSFGPPGA